MEELRIQRKIEKQGLDNVFIELLTVIISYVLCKMLN